MILQGEGRNRVLRLLTSCAEDFEERKRGLSANSPPGLLDALFRTDAMREIFSDRGRLQGMLDFEAALARARRALASFRTLRRWQSSRNARRSCSTSKRCRACGRTAGNPAIPDGQGADRAGRKEGQAGRALCALGCDQPGCDGYRTGAATARCARLDRRRISRELADALARLARKHKRTSMAGRTWLQQALPITFGLKAAGCAECCGAASPSAE